MPTLQAGALYFAMVFGASLILDPLAIVLLVRPFGARVAEFVEAPFMVGAIIVSARLTVRRLAPAPGLPHQLGIGLAALVLTLAVEFALSFSFLGHAGMRFLSSGDPVALVVHLAILGMIPIAPCLVAARVGGGAVEPVEREPEPAATFHDRTARAVRLVPSIQKGATRAGSLLKNAAWFLFIGAIGGGYAWMFDPLLSIRTSLAAGLGWVSGFALVLGYVRQARAARLVYLIGVLVSVTPVVLYPFWRGVRYEQYSTGSQVLLAPRNVGVDRFRATLWNPPSVYDENLFVTNAPVRWPFERPRAGAYAEPVAAFTVAHATSALVALGLLIGWWFRFRRPTPRDLTLHIALSVAVTLLIAWLCLLVLLVFSMGYLLFAEDVILYVLAGGGVAGLVHGAWDFRRGRRSVQAGLPGGDQERSAAEAEAIGPIVPDASPQAALTSTTTADRTIGADLFRFLAGLVLACLLAALALALQARISSYFPGAVARTMTQNESVTHALIAAGGGVFLCVIGWGWAAWAWRRGRRAFAAGVATGTTALALFLLMSIPFPADW